MSIQGSATSARNQRAPASLNPGLDHQLIGYALAASAAGVSMLAIAQPALAEIVFTETHKTILPNSSLAIDVNNDGVTDFTIVNTVFFSRFSRYGEFWEEHMIANAAAGNGVVLRFSSRRPFAGNSAAAMNLGSVVGPGRSLANAPQLAYCNIGTTSPRIYGQWPGVVNHYLGLAFQIDGETHYGWARLTVYLSLSRCQAKAVLTGYAYESVAGRPIIAGRTSGTGKLTEAESLTPTLGALALGNAGLAAWRREQDMQ